MYKQPDPALEPAEPDEGWLEAAEAVAEITAEWELEQEEA